MYKDETELFNSLKRNLINDLEKTSEYERTDCFSKQKKVQIELKCRKTHYEQLLIEKDKFDHLKTFQKSRYINSTPKGVFSFNIQKIDENKLNWFEMYLPTTTEFNNKEKKLKKVALIDITQAKNITEFLN